MACCTGKPMRSIGYGAVAVDASAPIFVKVAADQAPGGSVRTQPIPAFSGTMLLAGLVLLAVFWK